MNNQSSITIFPNAVSFSDDAGIEFDRTLNIVHTRHTVAKSYLVVSHNFKSVTKTRESTEGSQPLLNEIRVR
jgi:hypothetical protein